MKIQRAHFSTCQGSQTTKLEHDKNTKNHMKNFWCKKKYNLNMKNQFHWIQQAVSIKVLLS